MIRIYLIKRCLDLFLVAAVLISAVFTINLANAQNKELLELLEQYPEQAETIQVYTPNSKTKIGEVDATAGYTATGRQGKWLIVRFDKPSVPLWVSADYVAQSSGIATVLATRLNARLRPEAGAPIVAKALSGYRSPVLASRNGFVQIKLHAGVEVAIEATQATADIQLAPNQIKSSSGNASSTSNTAVSQGWDINASTGVTPNVSANPAAPSAPIASEVMQPKLANNDSASSKQARQHLIAPGDAISLLVFGEEDLSASNIRVPESGRVSLPLIGAVEVGGKTTKDVEDMVRKILSEGYVKNPRLSVTIFSYRPIFIRGAVRNTGSFPYTEGLTIAKALALAGGSKNSAKPQGISVLRDGVTVKDNLSLDSPYQIDSGDVITVDEEIGVNEDKSLFIYLHGEVASPGEYLYRRGLTVEKAIVLAGGFTLRGSPKKIRVTRYANVEQNSEPEKLKRVKLYTPIMPGDVINVGARWF